MRSLSALAFAIIFRSSLAFSFSLCHSRSLSTLHQSSNFEGRSCFIGRKFTTESSTTSSQTRWNKGFQMLVDVPKQVLVTGASGKTGFLTFKKLRELEKEFFAKGLVHSEKGAKKLQSIGASLGDSAAIKQSNKKLRDMGMAAEDEDPDIYIGDVVSGDGLDEAIDGCDALVILTSGVPKLRKREIFKSVLFKLIGQQRLPKFYYDQMPEQVDWIGCRNQIDAAKKAGVQHIVLVSSMGVSPQKNTPDNILNKLGDGNILVWKAKAEEYLKQSGVPFTIIHPGGLLNKPGGERELVFGVNDELLDDYEKRGATRAIPRADVAAVVVECLRHADAAAGKSFDVVSKAPGQGPPTTDMAALLRAIPSA